MALTKLTRNLIEGGTGTDWVTAIQTSDFTAEAGKGYFVNTTSQVLYVNLPVGVVGMEITIQDYAGTFGTNKVILNANGSEKIQGSALEGKINTNNATAVLIYQDAIKGWTSQDVTLNQTTISFATPTGQSLTYSTPSPQSSTGTAAATFPTTTFTATKAGSAISGTATITGLPSGITAAQTITGSGVDNTLTVTLTGTFPSTDSLNTNLTLSGLTVEAVPELTVGYLVVAGGGGGGGAKGGNATIYAAGGGGGGYKESQVAIYSSTNYDLTVGAGGSGGVGMANANNGSNSVFTDITATYGFGGGNSGGGNSGDSPSNNGGSNESSPYWGGGGGAGANGGGSNGSTGSGGNGGNGIQSVITGVATYYAGGGGGSAYQGGAGSGGLGGGGNARGGTNGNGNSGTPNTGGGGGAAGARGGQGAAEYTGGSGGSGIVILSYTNAYTITIGAGLTGSTTTNGSNKVTTFTAGTGNIQFN